VGSLPETVTVGEAELERDALVSTGELAGVGEKVEHNLEETTSIGDHVRGHVAVHMQNQILGELGHLTAERVHQIAEQVEEIRVAEAHFHALALELEELLHAIHQSQEVAGGIDHHAAVVTLLLWQGWKAVAQDLRHPHDTVQRVTHLV